MQKWERSARLVGTRIRQLRNEKDWSQEELAFQAGLYRTYVADIERGKRNPSMWSLIRIAVALSCRVGDLFPNGADSIPGRRRSS